MVPSITRQELQHRRGLLNMGCGHRQRNAAAAQTKPTWGGASYSLNSFSTFSSPASTSHWMNSTRRQRAWKPSSQGSVSCGTEEGRGTQESGSGGTMESNQHRVLCVDFILWQAFYKMVMWQLAAQTHILLKLQQKDKFSLPVVLA